MEYKLFCLDYPVFSIVVCSDNYFAVCCEYKLILCVGGYWGLN
jgi:hypothetical protein